VLGGVGADELTDENVKFGDRKLDSDIVIFFSLKLDNDPY
jgi:hypothetical protein